MEWTRICGNSAAILALILLGAWFFCGLVALAAGNAESKVNVEQYIRNSVMSKVCKNWIPTRTAKAVPIKIKCKIHKNGTVSDVQICNAGKTPTGEKRAIDAVLRSAPFDKLAAGSPEFIEVDVQLVTTNALQLTVPQAIQHYGPPAREILSEECKCAGVSYPPKRLTMIGLKQEKKLLLFAGNDQMKFIHSYPLVSYSGILGPKLKQGDLQIPEGVYRITGFQSFNMLALCVNYPNELDRRNSVADRRTNPGGDILIHGGSHSTGCLVVSDDDMEQLFVAVHDVGCNSTELIIAPCDLINCKPSIDLTTQPKWVPGLYKAIEARMQGYPSPK